jgi:hypothetical protein
MVSCDPLLLTRAFAMYIRADRARRSAPVIVGIVTLAGVAVLFAWDLSPRLFPAKSREVLAAFPLFMTACAYLAYQSARRPSLAEVVKAKLLALAFLFWAANHSGRLYPNRPYSMILPSPSSSSISSWRYSLVILAGPAASPDKSDFPDPASPAPTR